MESFSSLAVVLAVCLAISDSSLIRRQAVEAELMENSTYVAYSNVEECEGSKYTDCMVPNLINPYEDSLTPNDVGTFMSNRTNLEQLAASVQATNSCIAALQDTEASCQQVTERGYMDIEVDFTAEYLAESENLDVLVNLSSSRCFENLAIFEGLENAMFSCVSNLSSDMMSSGGNVCKAVDNMKNCFIKQGSRLCDPVFGAFVESVWDHAMASDITEDMFANTGLPVGFITGCYRPAASPSPAAQRGTRSILQGLRK